MNLKGKLTPACTNMSTTISGPFAFPGMGKNNQPEEIAWQIETEHCLDFFTTLTFFRWLTPEDLGFLSPKAPSGIFVPWGVLATDSWWEQRQCGSAFCISRSKIRKVQVLTLPSANKPPSCTWWAEEEGGDGEGNMKEEQFFAYPEKFPIRLGSLDHLSSKTWGWHLKMSNHVVSFAGGAWGSGAWHADALRTCMGWEPAHCSTNRNVIHSQGLSLIYPCHEILMAGSHPYPSCGSSVQDHLPFKSSPLQKTLMWLKAFQNHGVAIFYTKCHARWWKIFCRKFIHNYSGITETKMYSIFFLLSKYCCRTRKSDSPSSTGFTGSSHHLTFYFEQHPNSI